MGQRFPSLTDKHIEFIAEQKLFFVATAMETGRVNLSPKGSDSFRVLDPNRAVWLNLTGSGNETATHLSRNPRMTVMFCAFEGTPLILRLYGIARAIHRNTTDWTEFVDLFPASVGARQLVELRIELVQSSCGFQVPLYEFQRDRTLLDDWAHKKGEAGIRDYWREKNVVSLDGLETGIREGNLEGESGTGT